jgi:beta-ureidopropionase / N-carbamoyl-L-amino-acid hydrolase
VNPDSGIRPARIQADLEALAARTDPDRPWTRRAFSPAFLQGRAWLRQAMTGAGLACRVDPGGNLIGRREGRVPGLGAMVVGSHSDTVPGGGRFDGIAGVVAGIELARALADRGVTLDHDFEVIDCLAEEVSLFGVSCIGSRAVAGLLPDEWLDRSADDLTLRDGIGAVGGDPGRLGAARRDDIRAYLELHIEQGPILEAQGLEVGLVTAIVGITRVEILVQGRADHAGTTPMRARADALVAAAELVLAVREAALQARGPGHFVATIGEFTIAPNAANVVPASARLLVDARAERRADMDAFLEQLAARCAALAIDRPRIISDNLPTPADPFLVDELEAAAERVGASHRRMASGAGHDMAWFARIAPAAMLFVPCRGGRSHCPEEWAEPDAIALGAEVLLETLLRLDRRGKQE